LIIAERIIFAGKKVKAIFYERKKRTFRARLKRIVYKLEGKLRNLSYEGLKKSGDIEIFPVNNINSPFVRAAIREIGPDLNVVAGTRKLNKDIFDSSKLGAVNIHSGILPYYRGADSEFWALYNGEKEKIGVTIHFIDQSLDTGDIILTARQEVLDSDDYRSLRMKNIFLGAKKMVEAINLLENGDYERRPQDNSAAKTYKSATAEDKQKFKRKT
jgi:methionyl-tRNA formyltransferase